MKINLASIIFKKPLLPIGLAAVLTVASVGLTASPAWAYTLRTITNTSTGNIMNSSGQVGNVVGAANPVPSGYVGTWLFQISLNGDYEIHPSNNTSLCLTASTTQNLDKIETCDGGSNPPSNQLWADELIDSNIYAIESANLGLPYGYFIEDPSLSHANHAVHNNPNIPDQYWYQN
jgi:hypothetical protein